MIRRGNFSFNPNPECENGDTFGGVIQYKGKPLQTSFNLTQLFPHTAVCVGKTGLILGVGNQTNCDFPDGTQGAVARHMSFCSHEHPEWIARGLPECAEDCEHEIIEDRDTVEVGGVVYVLKRYYEDKVVP